jgi:hypothetical protein
MTAAFERMLTLPQYHSVGSLTPWVRVGRRDSEPWPDP